MNAAAGRAEPARLAVMLSGSGRTLVNLAEEIDGGAAQERIVSAELQGVAVKEPGRVPQQPGRVVHRGHAPHQDGDENYSDDGRLRQSQAQAPLRGF